MPNGIARAANVVGLEHRRDSRVRWAHRCTARAKHTQRRCEQWATPPTEVCRFHGGKAPQTIAAAERRLKKLLPLVVEVLTDLLECEDKRVRLKTAKYVASLYGIKPEPAQRKSRARGSAPSVTVAQEVLDAVAELVSPAA